MTLTKKELMTAVKLCSDVAVQRGLPNMRIRPKSHVHYNVRPPFHAHHKKQQHSVALNKGISSSSIISGKGRVVSTPLVHAPSNAKSKFAYYNTFHRIQNNIELMLSTNLLMNRIIFCYLKANTFTKHHRKRQHLDLQLRVNLYRMKFRTLLKQTVHTT